MNHIHKNIKFVLFLHLFRFFQEKIHCGNEMIDKSCFVRGHIDGERVYFINSCKPGEYCPREYNYPLCAKKATQKTEGAKCKVNTDCVIGVCRNGRCKVLENGDTCDYDENCNEKSVCSNSNYYCTAMKALGDPCTHSTDCKIGLECAGEDKTSMICIKIGTAADGLVAATKLACISGFTVKNKDGLDICASFRNETDCEKNDLNNKYYCTGPLHRGENRTSTEEIQCEIGWDDNYICPSVKSDAHLYYLEEFTQEFAVLPDGKYNRITNRYTLNHFYLAQFYLDFEYYEKVNGADFCIRDYYFSEIASSRKIHLTKYLIIALPLLF